MVADVIRTEHIATGAVDQFAIGFTVQSATDLIVYIVDEAGTRTDLIVGQYIVDLVGGTIRTLATYPADTRVIIERNVSLEQNADLAGYSLIPNSVLQNIVNRTAMQIQQVADIARRALRLPAQDYAKNTEIVPVADRYLVLDESGAVNLRAGTEQRINTVAAAVRLAVISADYTISEQEAAETNVYHAQAIGQDVTLTLPSSVLGRRVRIYADAVSEGHALVISTASGDAIVGDPALVPDPNEVRLTLAGTFVEFEGGPLGWYVSATSTTVGVVVSNPALNLSLAAVTWATRQTLDGAIYSLANGNGLLVAGTSANSIWTSLDGLTWILRQTLNGVVFEIVFANGVFVAAAGNTIWTSVDGITWDQRQTLNGNISALTFANGLFVAGAGSTIWTSVDGITWDQQQTLDGSVYGLTYGNGVFVAGTLGDTVWTSVDAITWVQRQTLDGDVFVVARYKDLFIAGTGFPGMSMWTSSDGITWNERATLDADVRSIAVGQGLVAVGTLNGTIWISPDGINWKLVQILDSLIFGLTEKDGTFIAGTGNNTIWTPGA